MSKIRNINSPSNLNKNYPSFLKDFQDDYLLRPLEKLPSELSSLKEPNKNNFGSGISLKK